MKLGIITSLAAFALVCCQGTPDPQPPKPQPVLIVGDGGVYDEPFDLPGAYLNPGCAAACANLQRFECPDGFRREGEDSCYVVCRRAEATRKIDFKTKCVADATSRTMIVACGTYRCR